LGGVGAALLGKLADLTDLNFVYHVCSFLPAIASLPPSFPTLSLPNQDSGTRASGRLITSRLSALAATI